MAESDSWKGKLRLFFKHPLVIIASIGIAIKALLIPFLTYSYDTYFWSLAVQHLESGNGLYGLPGYYYTPVWGYFLALGGEISNVLGIHHGGSFASELIRVGAAEWPYYREILIAPGFAIVLKIMLSAFDLLTAYLIYVLVRDYANDEKKAVVAFGLWFLCPIVIYTSAVQVMFDTIVVSTLVLSVLLIFRRKYFLAAAIFTISVFIKFFPFYLIFILLIWIARRERGGTFPKALAHLVFGAGLMMVTLYLPSMADGTFLDSFNFLTSRTAVITASGGEDRFWEILTSTGYAIVLAMQFFILPLLAYIAYRTYRYPDEDFQRRYMHNLMLSATVIFLWTPTPTYLLIILPFLSYSVVTREEPYCVPYVLISVVAFLYSLAMQNYSILYALVHNYGLLSPEVIIDGVGWLNTKVLGVTYLNIFNIILGIAETLSIYSIFFFAYRGHLKRKKEGLNEKAG